MGRYVLRRILIFLPVLVIISMITFWLSEQAPGDRVEDLCGEGLSRLEYDRCARLYGYDKAPFYFSIHPAAYPDTLYHFVRPQREKRVLGLVRKTGAWPPVASYEHSLWNLETSLNQLPDSVDKQVQIDLNNIYTSLQLTSDLLRIDREITSMEALVAGFDPAYPLKAEVQKLRSSLNDMPDTPDSWAMYIPKFVWHGFDNRYHAWFSRFIRLDFGTSVKDHQPVSRKMGKALFWTLLLNGLSFFFAFLIAIPVGVRAALKANGRFDRFSSGFFFMLFSLPRFWIATILMVFFTTGYYGAWMDIFPSIGLGDISPDDPFWSRFWERGGHLILPVFCQTYGMLAFITRQMRGGMLGTIRKDYIRTARAKGLPENNVIWKHAFRNALFPMITIFASIIPGAIAGSVIIEVIFAIPGMGQLMFESIFSNDWSVLFAGLMLGAFLTLVGVLVADLLYAWVDPNVRFANDLKSEANG
ncbi:MAG: ABC transporter permease [Saprospiraceae bacterium]|nr:ABC transporter permease [Saprospiraceae bacterium]